MSKIVHIITRLIRGGADENTVFTVNGLAAAGHEVWLVYGEAADREMLSLLDSRVKRIQIKSLVREIDPWKDLRAFGACVRALRRIKPDIVHTHTSKAGIIGRLASLGPRRPRIIHGVHILAFMRASPLTAGLYLAAERITALWTDAFMDVSPAMRDICVKRGIGRARDHVVVPSGMNLRRFRDASPASDLRARPGWRDAIIVGYAANYESRKRHREFVDAVRPLLEKDKRLRIAFMGQGSTRSPIIERIEELGLSDRIASFGFRNDVDQVIKACDICVYVSDHEGLPRAVIQYAVAGKPTVATRLPGIEMVIRDGVNGVVVEGDRIDLAVDAIARLCDDERLRGHMARGNMRVDLSSWSTETMVRRTLELYELVLDRRSGGGAESVRPYAALQTNSAP